MENLLDNIEAIIERASEKAAKAATQNTIEELNKTIDEKIERAVEKAIRGASKELDKRLDIRFAEFEKRMDQKITKANSELKEELCTRIDNLEQKFDNLERKVNNLEQDVRKMALKIEFEIEPQIVAIFDYIKLQQQKNTENQKSFEQMENKQDRNKVQILDHEIRIEDLENEKIDREVIHNS